MAVFARELGLNLDGAAQVILCTGEAEYAGAVGYLADWFDRFLSEAALVSLNWRASGGAKPVFLRL